MAFERMFRSAAVSSTLNALNNPRHKASLAIGLPIAVMNLKENPRSLG
jgi:hypothetical protein